MMNKFSLLQNANSSKDSEQSAQLGAIRDQLALNDAQNALQRLTDTGANESDLNDARHTVDTLASMLKSTLATLASATATTATNNVGILAAFDLSTVPDFDARAVFEACAETVQAKGTALARVTSCFMDTYEGTNARLEAVTALVRPGTGTTSTDSDDIDALIRARAWETFRTYVNRTAGKLGWGSKLLRNKNAVVAFVREVNGDDIEKERTAQDKKRAKKEQLLADSIELAEFKAQAESGQTAEQFANGLKMPKGIRLADFVLAMMDKATNAERQEIVKARFTQANKAKAQKAKLARAARAKA